MRSYLAIPIIFLPISLSAACFDKPEGSTVGQCSDRLDNDGDLVIDCDDPDCMFSAECDEDDEDPDDDTDDDPSYTLHEWAEDYIALVCALFDECELIDEEECLEMMDPDEIECQGFDARAAQDCMDGLEQTSCEQFMEGDYPSACDDVCDDGGEDTGFADPD